LSVFSVIVIDLTIGEMNRMKTDTTMSIINALFLPGEGAFI